MINAMLNSRRFHNIIAVMKMKAARGIPAFYSDVARIVPLAPRRKRWLWSGVHNGTQEMARRRRQIERSQLTASNGLAMRIPGTKRFAALHFDLTNRSEVFARKAA